MQLGRFIRGFMAPAPDPRREYRSLDRLAPELLADVRAALEAIAASRNHLVMRVALIRERLPLLEQNARQALAAGQRADAQRILERRQITRSELERLEQQLRATDVEAERLASAEGHLTARLEALAVRERILDARRAAAEIQVYVGEALAGIVEEVGRLDPDLARAEQHTEELEARAVAIDTLVDADELARLEAGRELEALEHGLDSQC